MTVKELNRILTANNIPEDARLMSDSGWEYSPSDMDGIYYNANKNIIIFTQYFSEFNKHYEKKADWVRVEAEKGKHKAESEE